SANVGDKIGNGEIGLVADPGDDGELRIGDGARDNFFVEGPHIYERAAATRKNQHVHKFFRIEKFQRLDDFLGRAFSLDARGKNGEMHVGKAAREDAHDVAHRGAARRSDETDVAGKKGQRPFARGVEEAFGFEALV